MPEEIISIWYGGDRSLSIEIKEWINFWEPNIGEYLYYNQSRKKFLKIQKAQHKEKTEKSDYFKIKLW